MLDHKLIIFYHLAQTPNTTKVAETLLLSQSAISKSIKELEKELSITLFYRIKGRLQLTPAGLYLLEATKGLIEKEREITFELNKMRGVFSGTLNIGASTTLSQYILPEILAGFTHANEGVRINTISGNTRQIEQDIQNGYLNIAFIEGTPTQPDIHYIPFIKDEIVLVCAAKNPIAETISRQELLNLKFVFREKGSGTYDIIKKHLQHIDMDINRLQIELILGTTEGIKHYLPHSGCFALVSIYSIREELASGVLKIVDIEGLSIERMFYAIHRQGQPDPYARQFLDYAFSHAKDVIR